MTNLMHEPWNWKKENLESLIGQAESIRLDFKQSKLFEDNREKIASNLSVEVSAFANTEGGIIVIGMAEKREGKARIASHIDDGVNTSLWPPERLQQLIESNVSPYLAGLRVRAISLDLTEPRAAYVIYVPQGSTAFQANDHRYYGRSEYESKSLPDYEVRLRMFRGKAPNGIVRAGRCDTKDICVLSQNLKGVLGPQHERFIEELSKPDQHPEVKLRKYEIYLVVENTGEVNLTEFKVRLDIPPENGLKLKSYSRTVKDGWLEYGGYGIPYRRQELQQATPMRVNIYPQDAYSLTSYTLYLRANENIQDEGFAINWTLYLPNTLPIRGKIEIANEFQQNEQPLPRLA